MKFSTLGRLEATRENDDDDGDDDAPDAEEKERMPLSFSLISNHHS